MPKPKHPLRLIRAASPHATQAAFAAFLGVPVPVVQAVESGRAQMTPRFAARVMELTGADDVELLRGADGRCLTVDGRRYTAEAFSAWQGSPSQAAVISRREALQHAHRATWLRYLGEAAPEADPAAPAPLDLEAVEDLMAPWQTCEFAAAPAREWKRLPEAARRLSGWEPAWPVPPQTRLCLSVQPTPSWDPMAVPPGIAAENAELFPPCYFTVAAGSGGCRAAAACWSAICREHGIDPLTGHAVRGTPTGSWRGFFRQAGDRYEPHAVLAGLDADESGGLPQSLFAAGSIIHGAPGSDLAGQALAFMEAHSEDAGSPAGILLFASLEGGTASALSSLLLEQLRRRFPSVPVLVIGVLPLSGISPVLTAPWHTALALQSIRRHASAALLFSNDQLLAQASRVWNMAAPGYAEANLLIAECLCALTAPLRFGGSDSPPVDLAALLDCFPAAEGRPLPVFTALCWPLAALLDRRLRTVTLPWLVKAALRRAIDAKFLDAEAPALGLFPRVRFYPGPDWITSDAPPEISATGRTTPGLHESVTVAGSCPVIQRTLRRLARQAMEIWKVDGAARGCAELGVSEAEMKDAIHGMIAL